MSTLRRNSHFSSHVTLCTMAVASLIVGATLVQGAETLSKSKSLDRAQRALTTAKSAKDKERAAQLVQQFVQRFPAAKQAPDLLADLIDRYDPQIAKERAAGMDAFRQLVKDYGGPFPDRRTYRNFHFRSLEELPRLVEWSFCTYPCQVAPGKDRAIPLSRRGGPASRVTLYRIPDAERRRLLRNIPQDRVHPGCVHDLWKRVPTDRWIEVGRANIEFPQQDNRQETIRKPVFDLSVPGQYVLKEEIDGLPIFDWLRVQTFGLVMKGLPEHTIIYAFDPWTGAPVEGLRITARMARRTSTVVTGADGLARVEDHSPGILIAERGPELQLSGLFVVGASSESEVYITTDRPIYRPGQQVQFKVVRRERSPKGLALPEDRPVQVEIWDSSRRVLQSSEHRWNRFGSFSGSFRLADEPPLGDYRILVHLAEPEPQRDDAEWDSGEPLSATRLFRVAEYRRPDIQATVRFDNPAPVLGSELRARISAEYYFGGPVAGAKVKWSLKRLTKREARYICYYDSSDVPIDWYTPADDPRSAFYREQQRKPAEYRWYGEQAVANGVGRTGPDGHLDLAVPTRPGASVTQYVLTATVQDLSQRTADVEADVLAYPGGLRIDSRSPARFEEVGKLNMRLVRVTALDGKPASGRQVQVSVLQQPQWNEPPLKPGRPAKTLASGHGITDENGIARVRLALDTIGHHRVITRVRGDAGREIVDEQTDRFDRPKATGGVTDMFELLADRRIYQAGETARLTILCPYAPTTALLTIDSPGAYQVRTIRIRQRRQVLEVPIDATCAPNILVTLAVWKEGECLGAAHKILVYPKDQLLDVAIATDRHSYRPGNEALVTLSTHSTGRPVAAEVELRIVDESVFALERDTSKEIQQYFLRLHEPRAVLFTTGEYACWLAGFGRSPWYVEAGGGIGGAGGGQSTVEWLAPAPLRKDYAETMLWAPHLRTGADGKATVRVDVPDSLTKWRITARAVAGSDRFGTATSGTLTRQNVILRLIAPRFYTQHDRGMVATIVQSNLDRPTDFVVRLRAAGIKVEGSERRVTVAPNSQERIDWEVRAAKAGTACFHAEALSTVESDAVEISLPVQPGGVERQIAQSGVVADGSWQATLVLPEAAAVDTASLVVMASTAGLQVVQDALPYLADYPYGCVEQTMSRFLPAVVATRAMKRFGLRDKPLEAALPPDGRVGAAKALPVPA